MHPSGRVRRPGVLQPRRSISRSLPDRSASVSLPDNWKIAPNLSGGGTIVAVGPDGENAFLGLAFGAMDTNNPAVQQTMRQASGRPLAETL